VKIVHPWTGGRRLSWVLLALAIGGLAGALIGIGVEPKRGLYAYLFAFAYWVGIAVAGLILLTIWHATNSRWSVVLRRPLESITTTLPAFAALFIPLLAGAHLIYPWGHPSAIDDHEVAKVVSHQRGYSNVGFWLIRAYGYFLFWIAVSEVLRRWSLAQDLDRRRELTTKQRALGAFALPFICFSFSFAVLDWVMSIEPRWHSTIFALYFWTGSFDAAVALLTLLAIVARGENLFGEVVNENHLASLGKIMFAMSAFWAYVAFDQWMLIWIANLPKEVHWYLYRTKGSWELFAIAIVIMQFVVPFVTLLSRPIKTNNPRGLATVAVWILVAHALDVYWMVLPAIDRGGIQVHFEDPIAFVGVGALVAAFAIWRLRGRFMVPVGDPYLHDSLEYEGK
jgi:hypothetical protein